MRLTRPLVFLDLELTTFATSRASIYYIGAVKLRPDGTSAVLDERICPPAEALIDLGAPLNEDVRILRAPYFHEQAGQFAHFFDGCDLAGFDALGTHVPVLAEEFARVGIVWPAADVRLIDVKTIFHRLHPRTLDHAVKTYLNRGHYQGEPLRDAGATLEVLQAMAEQHELPTDVDGLHDYCLRDKHLADPARLLYYDRQGELRYDLGKHRGKRVDDHPDFAAYMLRKNFPLATQNFLRTWLAAERAAANSPT